MIDYYNAFISYKHAPLDSKVAEDVQKSLEHYHIPRKIQKKTGRKRIERIFRDKDELPITSDLSDTISSALENADYLIVICSPNTKKSEWVRREINTFLKTHSRDRVLTVLAEGEPFEVIPEELLKEERIIEDENGNKHKVEIPLEPLSCDYRMPLKKARKEELPRLVAALVGCSYDELMNRQRQYRMRRLAVLFTMLTLAVALFGGYMYYSMLKINEHLRQSLANQSKYLANESSRLLKEGDRIEAIQLAMAALPDGTDDDRPVTAEAIRALTDATLAYRSRNGSNIEQFWEYKMPAVIKEFTLSPDGTKIAVLDAADTVFMWDTVTHEKVLDVGFQDEYINSVVFLDDDVLLIWDSLTLRGYDTESGELLWKTEIDGGFLKNIDIQVLNDGSFLVMTTSSTYYRVSSEDGKILDEYPMPGDGSYYVNWSVSPDDKYLVGLYFEGGEYHLIFALLETGECTGDVKTDSTVDDFEWADDTHFVTSEFTGNFDAVTYRMGDSYIKSSTTLKISCYDASSGQMVWSNLMESDDSTGRSDFLPLPAANAVAFYSGNISQIFDISEGEVLYRYNFSDTVIDMSDNDGDGWPLYITQRGAIASPVPSYGDDAVSMSFVLMDDLNAARIRNGIYAKQYNGRKVFYYCNGVVDEEWEEIEDFNVGSNTCRPLIKDGTLAAIVNEDDGVRLYIADIEADEYAGDILLDVNAFSYSSYKLVDINDGEIYIASHEGLDLFLMTVDVKTLETEKELISEKVDYTNSFCGTSGGKITFIVRDDLEYIACLYDVKSGKTERFDTGIDDYTQFKLSPVYDPGSGLMYLTSEHGDIVIDTKDGSVDEIGLPESWKGTVYVSFSGDGSRLAVTDNTSIILMDKDGKDQKTISCHGTEVIGILFLQTDEKADEMMIAAFADGRVSRYDADSGDFIGQSDISRFTRNLYNASFDYDREAHTLYIQIGLLLDIVDTESWYEIADIEDCLGRDAENDRFFTLSYTSKNDVSVGYFRHYTVDDLIRKANEILGDNQMTEEQRSRYGLA